ncbi:MAG: hypothetical protein AAF433_07570 [Bacteroidota bacterium]
MRSTNLKITLQELDLVKRDKSIYNADYTFNPRGNNQNNRLRLLIGLFNRQLGDADYDIASRLFNDETELRRMISSKDDYENYDVDVWYLSSYLLAKHRKSQDFVPFLTAKYIDFDSMIGFDEEHLFMVFDNSIEVEESNKFFSEYYEAKNYINNLNPNQLNSDLERWEKSKNRYFDSYRLMC